MSFNQDDLQTLKAQLEKLGATLAQTTSGEYEISWKGQWIKDEKIPALLAVLSQLTLPNSLVLKLDGQFDLTSNAFSELKLWLASPQCPRNFTLSLCNIQRSQQPYTTKDEALLQNVIDAIPDDLTNRKITLRLGNLRYSVVIDRQIRMKQTQFKPSQLAIITPLKSPLNIPEDAEFYVSLAKMKNDRHNCLCLGVIIQGRAYNLLTVGLHAYEIMKAGPEDAMIIEAPLEHANTEYTYKSFQISRADYLSFANQIRSEPTLRKRHMARAYLPSAENPSRFEEQFLEDWKHNPKALEADLQPISCQINTTLGPTNTCRQAATTAANKYLHFKDWGPGVNRYYFSKLPYQGQTEEHTQKNGKSYYHSKEEPIIFPRPRLERDEHYKHRRAIMRCLEIISHDRSTLGIQKFNAWKSLYLQLTPTTTPDRTALVSQFKSWMSTHHQTMSRHRNDWMKRIAQQFPRSKIFWTRSARLMDSILKDLEKRPRPLASR